MTHLAVAVALHSSQLVLHAINRVSNTWVSMQLFCDGGRQIIFLPGNTITKLKMLIIMLDGSHYEGWSRTPNAKTEKQNQYLSASKRIIKGKYNYSNYLLQIQLKKLLMRAKAGPVSYHSVSRSNTTHTVYSATHQDWDLPHYNWWWWQKKVCYIR
jgi:hypothetical protein